MLFSLLLFSCGNSHRTQIEIEGAEEFREGDLVLRCGSGMESRAVTTASQAPFSHIGILHYDSISQGWMVVHAVPGESAKGEPEYIKAEAIDKFFSPERAIKGAWLRIRCGDEDAQRAAQYALDKERQRVEFDNDYSLSDTTRLYCTELVWRAYSRQGIDISGGKRSDVPQFICIDGECIFPSHIIKKETP